MSWFNRCRRSRIFMAFLIMNNFQFQVKRRSSTLNENRQSLDVSVHRSLNLFHWTPTLYEQLNSVHWASLITGNPFFARRHLSIKKFHSWRTSFCVTKKGENQFSFKPLSPLSFRPASKKGKNHFRTGQEAPAKSCWRKFIAPLFTLNKKAKTKATKTEKKTSTVKEHLPKGQFSYRFCYLDS